MKPKIEILSPAGNMNKLKTAFAYGADAAYIAGKRFGLRAYADNFSDEEIYAAAAYAHDLGKILYVTVNIYADESDLGGIPSYAKRLESAGVDGVIVSDLGVFSLIREAAPKLELHVSTQANVTNSAAALSWAKLGAKRIVLARETQLGEISRIRKELPDDVEIEAFVHGAMCIAYSGRCLLSSYFTDRAGNKGECVQCCRWEYDLIEKSRGEKIGIEQAKALVSADMKIIANGGDVQDGMSKIGDILSSKGGTSVGAMLEGLAQTHMGKEFLNKFTTSKDIDKN